MSRGHLLIFLYTMTHVECTSEIFSVKIIFEVVFRRSMVGEVSKVIRKKPLNFEVKIMKHNSVKESAFVM